MGLNLKFLNFTSRLRHMLKIKYLRLFCMEVLIGKSIWSNEI